MIRAHKVQGSHEISRSVLARFGRPDWILVFIYSLIVLLKVKKFQNSGVQDVTVPGFKYFHDVFDFH